MPKTFKLPPGEPLLNIASYARRGPGERSRRLTPEQIDHIRRTVRRDPEVMVKVLSRGAGDFKAVAKHLDYISRRGKVELETDDGDRLSGTSSADLDSWHEFCARGARKQFARFQFAAEAFARQRHERSQPSRCGLERTALPPQHPNSVPPFFSYKPTSSSQVRCRVHPHPAAWKRPSGFSHGREWNHLASLPCRFRPTLGSVIHHGLA